MSIRIMMVDDHLMLREALRWALNAEPGLAGCPAARYRATRHDRH